MKLSKILNLRFIVLFIGLFFLLLLPNQAIAATTFDTITIETTGATPYSDIALSSNLPRIAYYNSNDGDLKFLACSDTTCSGPLSPVTVDSTGNVGQYVSVDIGSDGFARISYYDVTNGNLKFAQCTNTTCSTSNITTLDSTGDVGQYTSLKIAPDGFARISYYDVTNGNLKYIQCTNAACSTHVDTLLSTTGDVGSHSSLALGTDGFARISFYDASGGQLHLIICPNNACTGANDSGVDITNDRGKYSTLALNSSNFAFIMYYNTTRTQLMKMLCLDNLCSSKDPSSGGTTGLDGNKGTFSSAALNSSDLPRYIYYDASSGDLKYDKCMNTTCTGTFNFTPDSAGNVGSYGSMVLTSNDDARIVYADVTNGALKFTAEINAAPTATPTLTPTAGPSPTTGPSSTPSPTVSVTSSSGTSMPSAPTCGDQKPSSSPDLFQIDSTNTKATLYFAPAGNPTNKYYISYGLEPGDGRYGVEFNRRNSDGVLDFTVESLVPNTTYYFRIRGGNGCMPGEWSNEMQIKTGSFTSSKKFYKNVVSQISSSLSSKTIIAQVSTKNKKSGSCEYIVKSGDSLWTIATQELGNGNSYKQIMKDNNLNSTLLNTGKKLKVGC